MVNRHVGRARCGKSLMQGWGGSRSGRATHACPLRLPLSAGSLRLGRGGKEKLADCSATFCWRMLYLVMCWRRAQRRPWCWASGFVLREFTVNLLNGWLDIRKLSNMPQREQMCIVSGLAENARVLKNTTREPTYTYSSMRKDRNEGITRSHQQVINHRTNLTHIGSFSGSFTFAQAPRSSSASIFMSLSSSE